MEPALDILSVIVNFKQVDFAVLLVRTLVIQSLEEFVLVEVEICSIWPFLCRSTDSE